jgi:hypothetical protein
MIRHVLTAALLGVVLACLPARAAEPQRIDDEKAKEAAKALVDAIAKLELPVKPSVDGTSGTGLHAGKVGVFVVPDTRLTADALKKHEKGVLPLGILFMTDAVTLVSADKPVAAKDHLTTEVTIGDNTVTVNVVALAAARVADRLVLLAYAKGKKPVVVAELNEAEDKTDHVLDVEARKQEEKRAGLTINVLGKYKAALRLAAKEE